MGSASGRRRVSVGTRIGRWNDALTVGGPGPLAQPGIQIAGSASNLANSPDESLVRAQVYGPISGVNTVR